MTDAIDRGIFKHLVGLAALELDDDEAEYIRRELNNQLKAIHELEAIPLNIDTPTTSHGIPYTSAVTPPIREDTLRPDGEMALQTSRMILEQAPESDDAYIVVPEIRHEEI